MSQAPTKARQRAERYLSESHEYVAPGEREKLIADWEEKDEAAQRVVEDFTRRIGDPRGTQVLDVGCGNGAFMIAFAKAGAAVSGIEVNETLTAIANEALAEAGISGTALTYDGVTFPFPDRTFDFAFCASVLEHVSDPQKLLAETARVLKPGGKVYLAFPNRWRPVETHTQVWFLGYLPRSWARMLLRQFWKRNSIDELNLHFLSFWKLRRLMRGLPLELVAEREASSPLRRAVKQTLAALGLHISAFLGTVMVILQKRA